MRGFDPYNGSTYGMSGRLKRRLIHVVSGEHSYDDFKWFLPTDERAGDLSAPESEIDTSDSESGVDFIDSDLTPLQTESMAQQLYALRWSFRRDLWRAVTQQCPGDRVGDMMSGRRTIWWQWMPDKCPPLRIQ